MKALTWQAKRTVSVEEVPDPVIQEPTDAIVRITSSAICGSDLHLYEVLTPFMDPGDIIGHEPMGIVEEVGSAVTHIKAGDRVVIPFNVSCGHWFHPTRPVSRHRSRHWVPNENQPLRGPARGFAQVVYASSPAAVVIQWRMSGHSSRCADRPTRTPTCWSPTPTSRR
jgi:threonine dehydrogenase-like Zn-dependent dehydrogenase